MNFAFSNDLKDILYLEKISHDIEKVVCEQVNLNAEIKKEIKLLLRPLLQLINFHKNNYAHYSLLSADELKINITQPNKHFDMQNYQSISKKEIKEKLKKISKLRKNLEVYLFEIEEIKSIVKYYNLLVNKIVAEEK